MIARASVAATVFMAANNDDAGRKAETDALWSEPPCFVVGGRMTGRAHTRNTERGKSPAQLSLRFLASLPLRGFLSFPRGGNAMPPGYISEKARLQPRGPETPSPSFPQTCIMTGASAFSLVLSLTCTATQLDLSRQSRKNGDGPYERKEKCARTHFVGWG